MSIIAPKDKAFLDIKLVQECMDAQAKRISIAFLDWFRECKWDDIGECIIEGDEITPRYITSEQAYDKFIESITK